MNRRDFLKVSGAILAGATSKSGFLNHVVEAEASRAMILKGIDLRNAVKSCLNPSMQDGIVINVAVVGAGVSGLYTAWRLTGDNAKLPVQVFESSDRIGGRLQSVLLPGLSIAAELGGMRYTNKHMIVMNLVENVFRLDSVLFPMGDSATHFFYGRGQRCRADAWEQKQRNGLHHVTRYALPSNIVGWNSDQIFNKIVYDILLANPWFNNRYGTKLKYLPKYEYKFYLTLKDWDEVKPQLTYHFPASPYHGMKLNDMGFWNLIKDQVGEEAYEFLSVAGGYYSNTINWNAAEALPYQVLDFSDAATIYKTIDGGYDQIAYALAKSYLDQPNSMIWVQNRLVGIERCSDSHVGTSEGARYRLKLFNEKSQKHWTVFANHVVLAMPRRALELLDEQSFLDLAKQPKWRKNLSSVIMQPSFKLLMGFESPWWKNDFGATAGASVTDLPLRQCYYFGSDPINSHSILLASYNDMDTVSFWRPLEPGDRERFNPRRTNFAREQALRSFEPMQAAKVMVDEAMKQIRELHGTQKQLIPAPYITYFKDWSKDPYGGGYHAWDVGVQVHDVMRYMRQPLKAEAIHICGEAYSGQQGWVEGALCVAEKMLQDHFQLPKPIWLPEDYYLGW